MHGHARSSCSEWPRREIALGFFPDCPRQWFSNAISGCYGVVKVLHRKQGCRRVWRCDSSFLLCTLASATGVLQSLPLCCFPWSVSGVDARKFLLSFAPDEPVPKLVVALDGHVSWCPPTAPCRAQQPNQGCQVNLLLRSALRHGDVASAASAKGERAATSIAFVA